MNLWSWIVLAVVALLAAAAVRCLVKNKRSGKGHSCCSSCASYHLCSARNAKTPDEPPACTCPHTQQPTEEP